MVGGSQDRDSLYSDYYSTDGCYRPPKKPKNYGWVAAVLGLMLLCLAGGVAMARAGVFGTIAEPETASEAPEVREAAAETSGVYAEAEPAVPMETAEPLAETAPPEIPADAGIVLLEAGDDELSLPEIYQKVIPSVASITALSRTAKSTGTGIVMREDGYIITNYHVVSGAESIAVLLTDETEYDAELVGGDETSDLAVLKIDATGLTPAEFGDSDEMAVGDAVAAIGDPLGVELRGTLTDGIICGIHRNVQVGDRNMTLMQTNAALNSGNSGGPLVNMYGQVIGINTVKLSSYYTAVEGIGFAIPISAAVPILEELMEKGYVSGRPAFGFTVEALSTQMRIFYNLPGSICVRAVTEGSDAYQKGISVGDLILAVEGVSVGTLDEFNTMKNQFAAGDTVTLTVYHRGSKYDVEVTLMDRADLN